MGEAIQEQPISYPKDAHAQEQMSLQMTKAAANATDDRALRDAGVTP